MNLNDKELLSSVIRANIAVELNKCGHTILDAERFMTCSPTEKQALDAKSMMTALQNGGMMFLGSSLGAGALGGLGVYGAYKGLNESTKRDIEGEKIKAKIDQARQELETTLLAQQLKEQGMA